ncbi:NTP transferase domain-containing protein [Microbacterium sp. SD291]|uniref:nucleotidyltransferase family protein n=1 Tax=Microbacterium sp. SD291 TaxID=2782007 RepID=UPI001A972879|nr:nucleotidyltransferase family protein [Microbacterium sp. SD291]MBO0981859.1 nucleotidyltransferase family protein [Microbacterium sp. SD291]
MSTAHAIVLAAGSGTRLGRGPKALLPWGDEVLVTRAARAAALAGCTVTVAVGPRAGEIRRWLEIECPSVVDVHDAHLGMSASLRAAVRTIRGAGDDPRTSPADPSEIRHRLRDPSPPAAPSSPPHSVIVLLVDQPGVDEHVIRRLLDARAPGRVARAAWNGVPGNPVVFGIRDLLSAAALAEGDAGARAWISRHPHLVDDVECGDLGSGADIDEPADLRAWPQCASRRPA